MILWVSVCYALPRNTGFAYRTNSPSIGFDGIDLGRYIYPALTTVGQSIRSQGEIAAGALLERIRKGGEGRVRRIVMNPELTMRESTRVAAPFVLSRHE